MIKEEFIINVISDDPFFVQNLLQSAINMDFY